MVVFISCRLASDALYVPSIHHLKYRARDGMTSDGMSVTTEGDSQLVALTKYQVFNTIYSIILLCLVHVESFCYQGKG